MMQRILLIGLLLLISIQFVYSSPPQTLVVVKDDFSKYTYSRFFKSLKRRGHKITIKSSTDKSIKLTEYGESLYNNLIILSPTSKQIGDLSHKDILTFMDKGNNLLIGINNKYSSDFIKKIADRCGIEINPRNSHVYDHTNYDLLRRDESLSNDIILASNWPKYKSIISSVEDIPSAPILYSGIGMKFKKNSHLTISLLSGNRETYSSDNSIPIDKAIISSGNHLQLIAALQMRNNGRITFIGSLLMLSDEYFISPIHDSLTGKQYNKSGNEEFMILISEWTFGERGMLRVSNATHHQQPQQHPKGEMITKNPTGYRIKDLVTFEAKLEEYNLKCDCWKPFIQDDVQFEFIRLDAFIRQFMTHDGKGNYKIDFMLPDVFGIYKFTIDYKRKGWAYLFTETLVSVRPFRHDEYDRFLTTAYPYYIGCASMIVGFAIFTLVFLFGDIKDRKSRRKIWP